MRWGDALPIIAVEVTTTKPQTRLALRPPHGADTGPLAARWWRPVAVLIACTLVGAVVGVFTKPPGGGETAATSGAKVGTLVMPVDEPEITQVSYAVADHLRLAHDNRPDVLAARKQLEAERAALGVTANELMPALDKPTCDGAVTTSGRRAARFATFAAGALTGLVFAFARDLYCSSR